MCSHWLNNRLFLGLLTMIAVLQPWSHLHAQSTATLQGRVIDPAGAVVPGASIVVRHQATGEERTARSDSEGNYQVAALPVGIYRVTIHGPGFQTQIVESLTCRGGADGRAGFSAQGRRHLAGGERDLQPAHLIERATVSVGHVIDRRMVQEIPLNGRYFLDLGLLVPGSVTPPQNGFSAIPVSRQRRFRHQHRRQPRGNRQLRDQRHHAQQPVV